MSLKDEIHDQPAVLSRILQSQADPIRRIAAELEKQQVHSVLLAARGTSDNAGVYAKYLWGAFNRLPVAMAAPSLFSCYKKLPAFKDTLVVAISQSGESPDIVGVVEEGYRQGAPTLAITNEVDSPLARAAHAAIDICAGDEKAVAATKTYTATLLLLAMIAAELSDAPVEGDLLALPEALASVLDLDDEAARIAADMSDMNRCVILGRGYHYATAREWALKLKELSYTLADPYSSADFIHGPLALIEAGFPTFCVAPSGATEADMRAVIERLGGELEAHLLIVSDSAELRARGTWSLPLPPSVPEWLMPIVSIVPGQLHARQVTLAKGGDPEQPRSIRKVTLTN